jgi:hypothetical protein
MELTPTQPTRPIPPLIPLNIGTPAAAAKDDVVHYDLYQLASQDAPIFSDGKRLQDVYGTAAMPSFEWVRKVVSGQGSYDPNDPDDQIKVKEYNQLAAGGNLPTFQELYGPSIGNIAGGLVASSLVGAITDKYVGGSVGEILGAAAQDILPDSMFGYSFGTPLPSTQVADATAQAMTYTTKYQPGVWESLSNKFSGIKPTKLTANQTIFPELATAEVAAATGHTELYDSLQGEAVPIGPTGNQTMTYDMSNPEVFDAITGVDPNTALAQPGTVDYAAGTDLGSGVNYPVGYGAYAPVDSSMAQPGTSAYAAGTDLGTGVNYPVGYGEDAGLTMWDIDELGGTFVDPPTFADMSYVDELGGSALVDDVVGGPAVSGGITAGTVAEPVSYLGQAGDTLTSGSVWAGAGITAVASFGVNVLLGADPVEAAQQAGAAAIGGVIGQALIPIPVVGGMIGSAIGSVIGGRVICNELARQGLMDRRHVILDYKFTKEHLTPQHVNGYHFWAVHVVKKLRDGKNVKVWKHLATHRANEIAYICGERDRPDYLGKVYRHIGEPICWVIGAFCEKTDWSVLYNPKEI